MMPANKLFLLLITCALLAFACTSSKRKSPTAPPIGGGDQSGDNSKKFEELQDKITATLGKVATLQAQVGKGAVSQSDLDELEKALTKALTTAQSKIVELEGKAGNEDVSQTLKNLRGDVDDLTKIVGENEKLASNSGGNTPPTEEQPDINGSDTNTEQTDSAAGGDAPVLHVSLVEVEKEKKETFTLIKDGIKESEERSLLIGTYVTFHSDKDVVVDKIKYGEFRLIAPYTDDLGGAVQGDSDTRPASLQLMQLPVSVKFTHKNKPYCVTAKLGLRQLLPKGENLETDKVVEMRSKQLSNNGDCEL